MKYISYFLFLFTIGLLFFSSDPAFSQMKYVGVNLAGAEFGGSTLPGIYNQHYTYPTRSEVDYFVGKGMNIFRLPFKWERLQHTTMTSLTSAELSRIKNFVDYASSKEAYTILDPHNYARYYGDIIGTDDLPVAAFEDFWSRLAAQFKDNPFVIFGLMNEPHGMDTELWLADANAAIAAIRATGATNLILVPGNAYTGAHSWNSNWYGTPNGTVMVNIVDPGDNYAFEVHQYLDSNSSGTSESCVSTNIGAERLKSFTAWLRTHGKRGFLGEFGISANEVCLQAMDNMLGYMDDNSDVWLGWTYWAAGPWWGDYMFSVEPKNGQDRPQMAILEKHIGTSNSAEHPAVAVHNFMLKQNYPNPFNGNTRIEFELAQAAYVNLSIYDVLGNKIVCLVDNTMPPGPHVFAWDARNEIGEQVASGIYFYSLSYGQGTNVLMKRMVLLQ